MSERTNNRARQLFAEARERPEQEREAWLTEQCGEDPALRQQVDWLLRHNDPTVGTYNPGHKALNPEATATAVGCDTNPQRDFEATNAGDPPVVDGAQFISKLTELGVLSDQELWALRQSATSSNESSDPRRVASKLVSDGKLTRYQASALLKGQPELLVDKYLILSLLDSGGMGMVFQAVHRPMNRVVAIKMISKHLLASEEQVKRFQREVRVAATLEHPNVVRAYDADQSKGVNFLVMEYVRGENLTNAVKRIGPFAVADGVDCIRQAAHGLHYAHHRGIVHRDIKPGNLMLTDDGIVKVLDLGLANVDKSLRVAQSSTVVAQDEGFILEPSNSDLTQVGDLLGTVSFMAPEQAIDVSHADRRSDIYSLGCTLYYLLMGEAPYSGGSTLDVLLKHREGEIPTIRTVRPDVPESVDSVFRRMVAKDLAERYQSMAELLADLEKCGVPPVEPHATSTNKSANAQAQTSSRDESNDESTMASASNRVSTWSLISIAGLVVIALFGTEYYKSRWSNSTRTDKKDIATNTSLSRDAFALEFDGRQSHVLLPFSHEAQDPITIEVVVDIQKHHHNSTEAQAIVASQERSGLKLEIQDGRFNFSLGTRSGEDEYTRVSSNGLPPAGTKATVAAVYGGQKMRM
ncbi:MAG: serine/threonine-protein kinase, partial [Planctomycetota bacterium]